MVHAAVIQFQFAAERADGYLIIGVVGTRGEAGAHGIGMGNDIVGHDGAVAFAGEALRVGLRAFAGVEVARTGAVGRADFQRPVGLLGIDAALVVHNPGFAEERAGEEFEVEAYLADEFLRNGAVEVDGYFDVFSLGFHAHIVLQLEVGINHGIESGEVARRVGVAQRGGNAVGAQLAVELSGHGLPLSGCGFQPEVAVGGHAVAVHDDADAALVSFGINVVEGHDVHATVLEVARGSQLEVLGLQSSACQHCSQCGSKDKGFLFHGMCVWFCISTTNIRTKWLTEGARLYSIG